MSIYRKRLLLVSPLTYGLERLFYGFAKLSLAEWLVGRRESFSHTDSSVRRVKKTIRQARAIETYVISWLVLELTLIGCNASGIVIGTIVIQSLVVYRIFEIAQAQVNINIFSALRTHGHSPVVASLVRLLILSFINFLELILTFGLLYATAECKLDKASNWYDPYYFSAITQLTVGYGDLTPVGGMRLIAAGQAVLGFTITIIVIGRIVSFLPRVKPILTGR